MKLDEKRQERQLLGVENLKANNYVGTFHWFTGVGKSYGAYLSYNSFAESIGTDDFRTIVAVPTNALRLQWEQKIRSSKLNWEVNTMQGIALNLNQYKNVGMLILDEIHILGGNEEDIEKFRALESVLSLDAPCKLGLTASLERLDKLQKIIEFRLPVVDTITEEEARLNGWISEYKEYNWYVEFSEEERAYYDEINEAINDIAAKFSNDKGVNVWDMVTCLMSGNNIEKTITADAKDDKGKKIRKEFTDVCSNWRNMWARYYGYDAQYDSPDHPFAPRKLQESAMQYIKLIQRRKKLLANCKAKLNACLELADKFPLKTIVFGESTKFADRLELELKLKKLKAAAYHSNITSYAIRSINTIDYDGLPTEVYPIEGRDTFTIKQAKELRSKGYTIIGKAKRLAQILKDFASGTINIITSAKQLNMGIDVPDVELVVIVSRTRNFTDQSQRKGRGTRKTDEKGLAFIVNLIIPNTMDETWLASAQKTSKNPKIAIESVDEINTNEYQQYFGFKC